MTKNLFTLSLLSALLLGLLSPVFAHDGHVAGHDAGHNHEHDHKIGEKLEISDVWARETMGRTMSAAAYMVLKNPTPTDDKLIDVQSAIAKRVEIHLSKVADGKMTMEHVKDGLLIKKDGGTVKLKPGSYHIMFMGLAKPLAKGDVFSLTLVFEKAGKVTIPVEVRAVDGKKNSDNKQGSHHEHHGHH